MAKRKSTKQLETYLRELRREREAAEHEQRTASKRRANLDAAIQRATEKLAASRAGPIRVTDHAVVRYLERVEGVDIEAVRRKILTDEVVEFVRHYGSGRFRPANGFDVVARDCVIVTIAPDFESPNRRPQE